MTVRYLQLFPHQQQDWVNREILIDKEKKEAQNKVAFLKLNGKVP